MTMSRKKWTLVGSARGAWAARPCWLDWPGFLPPPPRSVHAVFSHTALRRSSPSAFGSRSPRPVWPRRDDGSVEADQSQPVRRAVDDSPPAVPVAALVALGDEAGQAYERVERDLVEGVSGVSVTEVARPATQEVIDVLHDFFDR